MYLHAVTGDFIKSEVCVQHDLQWQVFTLYFIMTDKLVQEFKGPIKHVVLLE